MSKIETDTVNANKIKIAETVIARFFASVVDSVSDTNTDDYFPRYFDYLQDAGVLIYNGEAPFLFSPFRNADAFRFLCDFVQRSPAWTEYISLMATLGVTKCKPDQTRAMATRLFAIFVRAKKIPI